MIRAAVAPYVSGACGVLVTEGDAPPLRVLAARTVEVGALVPLPAEQQTPRHTMTRRCGPDDVAIVGEAVMALLMAHKVERVTVEQVAGRTTFDGHARSVADEVRLACGDVGIVVMMQGRPTVRPAMASAFLGWPSADDNAATRAAGALLVASLGAGPMPASTALAHRDPAQVREHARELAATPPGAGAVPFTTPDPATLPDGRRVLAIDPGSRWVGVVVAVGDRAPLHLAHVATVELDARQWSAVAAVAVELATLARTYGCTHAVVERPGALYLRPDAVGHAANQGTHMVRTGEVGAALAMALAVSGVEVSRPTAAMWRAALIGRKIKGEARRNAVGIHVAGAMVGWPGGDDTHMRDAAGMALWAALPAPDTRAPRAPRPPGAPAPDRGPRTAAKRPSRLQEQEAKRRERAAVGCTCKGKHLHPCPLFTGGKA